MCGRYVSATPPDELARYFGAQAPEPDRALEPNRAVEPNQALEPNHNVAPTQAVHAVRETGGVRRLDTLRWGLVPFWAKDPKIGSRMINARGETVAEKNAFRRPLARRRCIIPADGFYEWWLPEGSKRKQPMFISRPDGDPFAFAGLWEVWRDQNNLDADGEPPRAALLHHHHVRGQRGFGPDPRPDAGAAAARRLGLLARRRQHRRRRSVRDAGSRAVRAHRHASRVDRRQQRP